MPSLQRSNFRLSRSLDDIVPNSEQRRPDGLSLPGSSPEFVRSLHPGMLPVVANHMRQALPSASNYATQMLGTATFWNRCGEATTEDG